MKFKADTGIEVKLGDESSTVSKTAIKAMAFDGSIYGVPYSVENIALLPNTDLLPAAATTFEEVIAAGRGVADSGNAQCAFLVGLEPKQGDP